MERTALIYLTKQVPAGAFANIRGLLWNVELRRFLRRQTNNGPATVTI